MDKDGKTIQQLSHDYTLTKSEVSRETVRLMFSLCRTYEIKPCTVVYTCNVVPMSCQSFQRRFLSTGGDGDCCRDGDCDGDCEGGGGDLSMKLTIELTINEKKQTKQEGQSD